MLETSMLDAFQNGRTRFYAFEVKRFYSYEVTRSFVVVFGGFPYAKEKTNSSLDRLVMTFKIPIKILIDKNTLDDLF